MPLSLRCKGHFLIFFYALCLQCFSPLCFRIVREFYLRVFVELLMALSEIIILLW